MDFPYDDMSSLELAEALQNILILACEGNRNADRDYRQLRLEFLNNPEFSSLLPSFVRSCRDLHIFWGWIKDQSGQWEPRRHIVRVAFSPMLEYLERGGAAPHGKSVSETLETFDAEGVATVWRKASARQQSGDAEGAITSARALLETVCKHIIEAIPGDPAGLHDDLPKLYRQAADRLKLAPGQHTEDAFKQILSGCTSVVHGLATLRNKLSDAHGQGPKPVRPHTRHAALAVNLSGTMATFLIETYRARVAEAADVR